MLGLITDSLTYLFPGGRVLKLIKQGVNITNSSNPLILTKNITLTVIAASVASPNPVTIGSAIHLIMNNNEFLYRNSII